MCRRKEKSKKRFEEIEKGRRRGDRYRERKKRSIKSVKSEKKKI